ncbi:unnamed protein product, partial [Iphiclides podalirius]
MKWFHVCRSLAMTMIMVESTRTSRRSSTNLDSKTSTSTVKIDDVQPTFRPRSPRRREEPTSSTPRDNVRSRARSRITDTYSSNIVTEQPLTENGRNERFDSRKTNRVRSRPIESESNAINAYPSREIPVKNKARQVNRRFQYATETSSPSSTVNDDGKTRDMNIRRTQTTSTEVPLRLSSPNFDDIKTETVASTFNDITRTVPKEEDITTVQFKRRSSTTPTIETETVGTPRPTRSRGRVNTRANVKLEDMASSGATLTLSETNAPIEKLSEDPRKSRKLRYRTRFAETDTNLTGEGITNSNEISKSARKKQSFSSEAENRTSANVINEKKMERRSERKPLVSPTIKSMRVVRRPLSRQKDNSASLSTLSKVKTSDEIGDDDNYPETFKALIQTKNALTQVSSPTSESLSVKATHTVINTITQSSLYFNTSREPNNNITRLRSKLNVTENELKGVIVEDSTTTESASDTPKYKPQQYRLRGTSNGVSTDTPLSEINETPTADKKIENTVEMPLIFTLINKPNKNITADNGYEYNQNDHKGEFLIAVSSKESQENKVENEIIAKGEESENKPIINVFATTQKYHSNYKDQNLIDGEKGSTPATPAIRNIQTRKYSRKITKTKDKVESTSVNPVTKAKEKTLRKYSDTFSKTTEASNNGITIDSEKRKSRFSSKYRESYLDKPFYKPTVPTVTPTTVEGEEIQLGPDMNAISFTQSRSTLSSADLKLSESLVKPSHVMNVEASNHSPSVTVSIFDALAEILTSTPRIQLSSTTEVPQQFITDSVVNKQTLNGISSSAPNVKDSSFLVITTATTKPFAEKSTASHVLSLRTTTMLPSIHEILLNSLSSATKEEMVISSMTSSTREPRILTLDIDPETKQIRTEKPGDEKGNTVFKFIPIDEVTALLNQVVVTPKARRTTTLPPPPPAPRRPILDGLAWLWQQWRDTAPGSGDGGSRTNNRRPAPSSRPSVPPSATPPPRANWFGSGPFVGNADDRPSSNRIPLEPPRAVAAEQTPGRGQLVSAAINVTRAFSQFLGAAIQGAAQTVQNVIRAGQKAATDVYTNGSG